MTDEHTHTVVDVAVTSAMLAASTSVFAWAFSRFTVTSGDEYCALTVVYGTVWLLVLVFSSGVAWGLADQIRVRAKPRPPTPPGPTPPPEQPPPGGGTRPKPGPVQPPRPPRRVETTLVDLAPVSDVTQELPRVLVETTHWRPLVAPNSRGRD